MRSIFGGRGAIAAGAALLLLVTGCGTVAFDVTKEVTGGGTPTGEFRVHIECEDDGFGPTMPTEDDLEFDGPGDEQSVEFAAGNTCTITEPEDGGATSTTFECSEPVPSGVDCDQEANGLEVTIDDPDDPEACEFATDPPDDCERTVAIRIVNDFPTTTTTTPTTTTAPPAAAAAVTQPNFTG